MEATEILTEEHRLIQHVLAALERQSQSDAAASAARAGFFLDVVDFVRNFADGCHHRKEENALFPAMASSGVAKEGGPIGMMLAEHEQGRVFNRGMEAAARAMQAGDSSKREELIRNAQGYVSLLRQHIEKEEGILFPMAERSIPPGAQQALAAEFDRIEREETGAGVHEKFHALAESLVKEAGLRE